MSMTINYGGYERPPRTPAEWIEVWSRARGMWVPRRRAGGVKHIDVVNLVPIASGTTLGNPDLLVTRKDGARFYVQFRNGNVFQSLDLPLLVHPPEEERAAFWVMPMPAKPGREPAVQDLPQRLRA